MVRKDDIWSYDIFNLRHVTKVAAHFQRQKIPICSFKYTSEEKVAYGKTAKIWQSRLYMILKLI